MNLYQELYVDSLSTPILNIYKYITFGIRIVWLPQL